MLCRPALFGGTTWTGLDFAKRPSLAPRVPKSRSIPTTRSGSPLAVLNFYLGLATISNSTLQSRWSCRTTALPRSSGRHRGRLALEAGVTHAEFAASSVLQSPSHRATAGYAHNGRVRATPLVGSRSVLYLVAMIRSGAVPCDTLSSWPSSLPRRCSARGPTTRLFNWRYLEISEADSARFTKERGRQREPIAGHFPNLINASRAHASLLLVQRLRSPTASYDQI